MLSPKQMSAIELLVCSNLPLKDIAKKVGVSASALSRWKKNEEFQKEYSIFLREVMNDSAAKALKTVTDIMLNSDSDNSRLSAAKDLLDRAGCKSKDNDKAVDMQLNIKVNYGSGESNEN